MAATYTKGSSGDTWAFQGNMTVGGTMQVTGAQSFNGDITLGNAVTDSVILNGRVVTSSLAGAALTLDATYLYNELIEIRANVTDWSKAANFTGAYFRFGNTLKTTSYNLTGMELNVSSDASVVNLSGLYSETQCKALAAGSTWTKVKGIEANLSLYDQTQTVAVTEGMCFYATIGLGSGYTAYTGLHGMVIETRDGSVGTRTLGSGIVLRNISPAEGTQTFTKGFQLAMAAVTGISLEGTMTTGISITGAVTTGISVGTSGAKLTLSAAANRMFQTYSTSSLTSGNIVTMTVSQTMTGASATNSVEVAQFQLTSAVQLGVYANALAAKIDLSTAGYTAGLVGVASFELDMPGGTIAGGVGTYTLIDGELNLPTSFVSNSVPMSFAYINVWGAQKAQFDDTGYLFDINGVSKASGKFFQDNTATAASQALRIRVNGTPYYIMLTATGA